jgi:hypothetical protein
MNRVHASESKHSPDEMRQEPGTPIPDAKVFGDRIPMAGGDNGLVMGELEGNSTFSNKSAISEKIRELEISKERSDVKFERDLAALKLLLSIM